MTIGLTEIPPPEPVAIVPPFWEQARILAEPTRAKTIDLLLEGEMLPVSYLARYAGVSAQTMTAHVTVLRDAGWVRTVKSGRYRYVCLVDDRRSDIAGVVEHLMSMAGKPAVATLNHHRKLEQLSRARTCYDHIAGQLGVELLRVLVELGGVIDDESWTQVPGQDAPARVSGPDCPLVVGDHLDEALEAIFGIGVELVPGRGRSIGACLDWSEKRLHCSGRIGRTLLVTGLRAGFIEKRPAGRSLVITTAGASRFAELGSRVS